MQKAVAGKAQLRANRGLTATHATKAGVLVSAPVVVKEHGSYSIKGTVRKVNEDRYDVKVCSITACFSVVLGCSRALLAQTSGLAPSQFAIIRHYHANGELVLFQIADPSSASVGEPFAFAGVYDGHGEHCLRVGETQVQNTELRLSGVHSECSHDGLPGEYSLVKDQPAGAY